VSASVATGIIIGNVTKDPEVRDAGKSRCANFTVAVNQKIGEKEHTTFVPVVCWGKLADVIERWVRKGQSVFVQGELRLESWEKDGQKHSMMKLIADKFQMLGGRRSDESGSSHESETSNELAPTDSLADAPF
jgi:single-strand DNA-binding protein